MNEPEQPNVPLLAKSCVIGTDGICRITYWDGHQDALSDCRWVKMPVVDAEECIRQLYKFIYQQAKRVRELEEDVKVISAANRDLATAVQRIREENRRLKAVAEAAKELIDWLRVDLVESTRAKKVRDALIELEEISNNG